MLKVFSLLNINLLFSILGIYISYFTFGLHNYMYPRFEIFEIYLSCFILLLIIVFFISIFVFLINRVNNISFKKIFEYLIFSITFYFIFHFTIRFMDLNYYHIYQSFFKTDTILIKIFFYGFPIFIGFFICLLFKKKIYSIQKFIFIFLTILILLISFRLFNFYLNNDNQFNPKNDFQNFNVKENQQENNTYKKIFLLVFDEFDYAYLDKQLNLLPNLKKIYETSYVNKNFYSPAEYTIDSIPSILTGSSFKKRVTNKGQLSIITEQDKKINFNFENSIFNLTNKDKKISASIYGDTHPYCRVFKAINCYDRYQFKKERLNIFKFIQIFFHVSYLEKILKIKPFFRGFKSNFKLIPIKFSYGVNKIMYDNSNNFINSDTDIIFVHYPYPKISDEYNADNFIEIKDKNKNLNKYEKNLLIVDSTIQNIFYDLLDYKGSLMIITTDHWLRDKKFMINDKKKIVFLSKIIGDNEYFEDLNINYSKNIKKLIIMYNKGMITSNYDINNFFTENNE